MNAQHAPAHTALGRELHNSADTRLQALLAVVQETMQPAHVSLWVRPLEPSRQQNTRLLPRIDEGELRAARRRGNTAALPA